MAASPPVTAKLHRITAIPGTERARRPGRFGCVPEAETSCWLRYAPLPIGPQTNPGDMTTPRTSIRLIELDDAEALAAHLGRDAEAFARWDPERAPECYTPAEQRSSIEGMLMQHHNGELWPGVVLADDVVIGQVTAQNILRRAWRKAELGYWIAYPYQGQGACHACG